MFDDTTQTIEVDGMRMYGGEGGKPEPAKTPEPADKPKEAPKSPEPKPAK